jgi:hypothetical protein
MSTFEPIIAIGWASLKKEYHQLEYRNPKQIRIFKIQNLQTFLFGAFEIWSFEIVLSFACLREAAPAYAKPASAGVGRSAKAGISCFGFRPTRE